MRLRAIVVSMLFGIYVYWAAQHAWNEGWVARAQAEARRIVTSFRTHVVIAGVPSQKHAADRRMRWPAGRVTISLDDSVKQLGAGGGDAIMDAVGAWLGSGATLPEVAFDAVPSSGPPEEADGRNAVYVAPIAVVGHEDDPAITVLRVDDSSGEIVEADIILNSARTWARLAAPAGPATQERPLPGCTDAWDVQSIATHEFGHFFGLADEGDDPERSLAAVTAAIDEKLSGRRGDRRPRHPTMSTDTPPCTVYKRELSADAQSLMTTRYEPSTGTGQ